MSASACPSLIAPQPLPLQVLQSPGLQSPLPVLPSFLSFWFLAPAACSKLSEFSARAQGRSLASPTSSRQSLQHSVISTPDAQRVGINQTGGQKHRTYLFVKLTPVLLVPNEELREQSVVNCSDERQQWLKLVSEGSRCLRHVSAKIAQ